MTTMQAVPTNLFPHYIHRTFWQSLVSSAILFIYRIREVRTDFACLEHRQNFLVNYLVSIEKFQDKAIYTYQHRSRS